ncbi:hypothetical protein N9X81_00010 [Schleiferiaceae bacterium]|nr:hypothetical protein [Schleiferiaceae bacterium]
MLRIKFFKLFIQADTNLSLQRQLTDKARDNDELLERYTALVKIADKIKYKQSLSSSEAILGARYYRSLKNELAGKTLRYDDIVKNHNI